MPISVYLVNVFISSPDDVSKERECCSEAISTLNNMLANSSGIVIKEFRWEKNAAPGIASSAQQVIDDQTPDYDIYIGIIKSRYGTITRNGVSGTEWEFNTALHKWQCDNSSVQIMIYFASEALLETIENKDPSQLILLNKFKNRLSSLSSSNNYEVLYKKYDSTDQFMSFIVQDLFYRAINIIGMKESVDISVVDDVIDVEIYKDVNMEELEWLDLQVYVEDNKKSFTDGIYELARKMMDLNNNSRNVTRCINIERRRGEPSRGAMREAINRIGPVCDAFCDYVDGNIEETTKYFSQYIRGMIYLNKYNISHDDVEIENVPRVINDMYILKKSMHGARNEIDAFRLQTKTFPRATQISRDAVKRLHDALESIIYKVDKMMIDLDILIDYMKSEYKL